MDISTKNWKLILTGTNTYIYQCFWFKFDQRNEFDFNFLVRQIPFSVLHNVTGPGKINIKLYSFNCFIFNYNLLIYYTTYSLILLDNMLLYQLLLFII